MTKRTTLAEAIHCEGCLIYPPFLEAVAKPIPSHLPLQTRISELNFVALAAWFGHLACLTAF